MPKVLTVNVPTDGVIVISRKTRRFVDGNQLDCFTGYRSRWMAEMAAFIRAMPMPVAMSQVRVAAGKAGMAAPVSKNWYGSAMFKAGLRKIGYQASPIKSRAGGVEAIWELA
jgi:hypothetical protein